MKIGDVVKAAHACGKIETKIVELVDESIQPAISTTIGDMEFISSDATTGYYISREASMSTNVLATISEVSGLNPDGIGKIRDILNLVTTFGVEGVITAETYWIYKNESCIATGPYGTKFKTCELDGLVNDEFYSKLIIKALNSGVSTVKCSPSTVLVGRDGTTIEVATDALRKVTTNVILEEKIFCGNISVSALQVIHNIIMGTHCASHKQCEQLTEREMFQVVGCCNRLGIRLATA